VQGWDCTAGGEGWKPLQLVLLLEERDAGTRHPGAGGDSLRCCVCAGSFGLAML